VAETRKHMEETAATVAEMMASVDEEVCVATQEELEEFMDHWVDLLEAADTYERESPCCLPAYLQPCALPVASCPQPCP